jgi:putative ATP-binding cassette transporter
MPPGSRPPLFGLRFLRVLWRLASIYWTTPQAKRGFALLAGAMALELATVYGNFLISDAERHVFDALETKTASSFFAALGLLAAAMAGFVVASTLRIWLRQLLEIRWREGVTQSYVERWMGRDAFCQSEMHRAELDNPDQRIAEDIRDFAASALGLSLSLLQAVATLLSFGGLLWALSRHVPVQMGGADVYIPGMMLWVAIAWAAASTWLTHVVGNRLVRINFDKLRFEADFRYGLVWFRENVESVVLSRGEAVEQRSALSRFGRVMQNWWELIRAQRNLSLLTGGIGQASSLVPLLVAVPAYLGGHLSLGTVAQVRFAYGQVAGALTWFVNAYQEIARWRANIERLATFAEMMDETERELARAGIQVVPGGAETLRLANLELDARDGTVLMRPANAEVCCGDRLAITGPSGAGKTTLLRAIAGVWPFGSGRIEVPPQGRMLFLPQRPYFPLGTLRTAVTYPSPEGTFSDEQILDVLRALGLDHLAGRLDRHQAWDEDLSAQEQQRLAIARVLLHEPEWVFFDKATSALDEETEQRVYALMNERLPHTTIVTVAHRAGLEAYHNRRWQLTASDHEPSTLVAA